MLCLLPAPQTSRGFSSTLLRVPISALAGCRHDQRWFWNAAYSPLFPHDHTARKECWIMSREALPEAEGDTNLSPRRRAWSEAHLDAESPRWSARCAGFAQSVSTPCLSAIRHAEGIWIEDFQGRRYMDFHGNNVHHLGYGHPRLIDAIRKQMERLTFAPRRYTCTPAVELAEKLVQITPTGLGRSSSHRAALMRSRWLLAYARAATGRFKTISFWDSYHGAGFGARSVGGEAMFRSGPIGPLLSGTEHVPPFGDYRNAWG